MDVVEYNKMAWNAQVDNAENPWTKPVSVDVIKDARKGIYSLLLTENRPVPKDWMPDLKGKDVLALASGGGQQGPVMAALGANVTVFDNSPRQLEMDLLVAEREGMNNLKVVNGDARDLSCFEEGSFDFIFHPVSNLFIPEIRPVWSEAFRVLRRGGSMVSGFINPIFYIFDYPQVEKGILEVKYPLPYSDVDHPEMMELQKRSNYPVEFGHSLTDQIAGQTDVGFLIAGFYEDVNSTVVAKYTPTYIATKALKL